MLATKKKVKQKSETLYKLPLILEPQPEGGYTVTCPLLPELITEGDTAQEAIANVADALAALLDAYEKLKRPVPKVLKQATLNSPLWLEAVVTI
jgi:antitoxin HicB